MANVVLTAEALRLKQKAVETMVRYHTIGDLSVYASESETAEMLDAIANYIIARLNPDPPPHGSF